AGLHGAHETLAHDRPHGAAEEAELEGRRDDRHLPHRPLHHDKRVGLAGFLRGLLEALAVLAAVLELERIERHHLGGELGALLGIEEEVQALACGQAIVEPALGTHVQVVLEVGEVEHRLARRAFAPEALGHRLLLLGALVLDLGRHELAEPAHVDPRSLLAVASAEDDGTSASRNSRITLSAVGAAFCELSAMACTMRLPITTASATRATRAAVAPSRMPKPTPTGTFVRARMRFSIASTSAVSMCAAPVTPFSDT